MARISFNRNEVEKVVELANKQKVKILLVKDEGIYIMACFEKTKEISYAKGCNPKIDEDWYSKSYVVSNNDFVDYPPISEWMENLKEYKPKARAFTLNVSSRDISLVL